MHFSNLLKTSLWNLRQNHYGVYREEYRQIRRCLLQQKQRLLPQVVIHSRYGLFVVFDSSLIRRILQPRLRCSLQLTLVQQVLSILLPLPIRFSSQRMRFSHFPQRKLLDTLLAEYQTRNYQSNLINLWVYQPQTTQHLLRNWMSGTTEFPTCS